MANEKPLRFAMLCRVSTEKQAHDRKVSLANQEKQIRAAVEAMGGTITREYKGSQHATPGHEAAMVNQLLAEAQHKRKPFDAVMVAEPSRWSRDNVASATGLDILKANGIRFFCGGTEYDLFDPVARLVLAQFATINQYLATTQNLKSVQAKIAYARQGRPCSGNLPFGRTWDPVRMEWGVDPEKKRVIEDIAKRYLAGESLRALAVAYGMSRRNLHEVLRNKCGKDNYTRFDIPSLNIKEVVKSEIPALLPPHTIKAVRKRMEQRAGAGGTGNGAHDYLLGGHVRCIVCGACLSPQTNRGTRHYRYAATCGHIGGLVRADDLEKVVAAQLVGLMGNPAAVAAAAKAHQVALGNVVEQRDKIAQLDKELAKLAKGQKRAMDLLLKDLVDEAVVHTQLAELRDRQHKLEEERDQLAAHLAAVPTDRDVERAAKRAYRRLQHAREAALHTGAAELPPAEIKAIIKEAFHNTTHPNGKWPGGVYIKSLPEFKGRRHRRWGYELHGNLPDMGAGPGVGYGHTDLPPQAFDGTPDPEDPDPWNYANACGNPRRPRLHRASGATTWENRLRVHIKYTDYSETGPSPISRRGRLRSQPLQSKIKERRIPQARSCFMSLACYSYLDRVLDIG